MSFSIAVPEKLKKKGRTFYLIRVHNGERKVLASTTGDVLEGKTNLFSTYMIAYKEAPTASPTPKPVPRTGDSEHPLLWAGMILIGLLGLAVIGGIAAAAKRKK